MPGPCRMRWALTLGLVAGVPVALRPKQELGRTWREIAADLKANQLRKLSHSATLLTALVPIPAQDEDDGMECDDGCSLEFFCVRPPCEEGEDCEDVPLHCADMDFDKCDTGGKECPRDQQAGLCAKKKDLSQVCEQRAEHESPNKEQNAGKTWADILEPGKCKAVENGPSDWYCMTVCTSVQSCPEDLCMCGDLPQNSSAVPGSDEPIWECKDEYFMDPDVKGLDLCMSLFPGEISDFACATSCGSGCAACPLRTCQCGPVVAEAREQYKKDMIGVCEFDNPGCIDLGNGAQSCQMCSAHITNCMATAHMDEDNVLIPADINVCLEEIATTAKGCEECNTDKSARAWKVRSGDVWEFETDEHDGSNGDGPAEEVDENEPGENNCWGNCLKSQGWDGPEDGDGKAKAK
mmetsp:Transcript_4723/g.11677  ORF Transcript_4723/g.11677 Transcript_4723/m.11677 type:complete len:408 (+) Transcript_4723:35-1258(+)